MVPKVRIHAVLYSLPFCSQFIGVTAPEIVPDTDWMSLIFSAVLRKLKEIIPYELYLLAILDSPKAMSVQYTSASLGPYPKVLTF